MIALAPALSAGSLTAGDVFWFWFGFFRQGNVCQRKKLASFESGVTPGGEVFK